MENMGKVSKSDRELFRDAIGDVEPVRDSPARVETRRKPSPEPRMTEASEQAVFEELLSRDPDLEKMESGEELAYLAPGVQNRILRRLRRGRYSVGADLDLHQMSLSEARSAVVAFLRDARDAGITCVKIVHGKGLRSPNRMPELKRMVNGLLRRRSEVVAFASAPRADGGTGAVYVLLRR